MSNEDIPTIYGSLGSVAGGTGVASAHFDESGHLILTMDDGTEVTTDNTVSDGLDKLIVEDITP